MVVAILNEGDFYPSTKQIEIIRDIQQALFYYMGADKHKVKLKLRK